jgi:pimeloyl-ACP methyl ester carboxylesterase
MAMHGTPGSRLDRVPDPTLYERVRVHVVTFDRPGYGRSTPQRDRTILSVADDAVAIADELGWSTFAVLGVSGGGPHALAVGARAPERLVSLGLVVGAPPEDLIDPDDLIEINREALRHTQEGREALEAFLAEPAAQLAADPGAALDSMMADAPEVDRELLSSPPIRDVLLESLRESFANGPTGWFDDSWCMSPPWDFALSDVKVPVRMWYGELDRNVPLRPPRGWPRSWMSLRSSSSQAAGTCSGSSKPKASSPRCSRLRPFRLQTATSCALSGRGSDSTLASAGVPE